MSRDYTIDDLASDQATGGGGGSSDGDGGQWLVDLYDRLDESGRLDQILFGPQGDGQQQPTAEPAQQPAVESPEEHAADGGTTDGTPAAGSQAAQVDAQQLAQVMKEIYDRSDMIPGVSEDPKLSEMIKLVESKPQVVNKLLQQYL